MLRHNFFDMAKWLWRMKMGMWVSTHPKCIEINYFNMSKNYVSTQSKLFNYIYHFNSIKNIYLT